MRNFNLRDDFTNRNTERSLTAAVRDNPSILSDLPDALSQEVFFSESTIWSELKAALKSGSPYKLPSDWAPATDPGAVSQRLLDLRGRRQIADLH